MPDHIVHYHLGFSKQQFQQILSEVPRLSGKHRGAFALAAYLIKLRTGDSDERIASLLRLPRSTLESLMHTAREILHQDFVPRNLGLYFKRRYFSKKSFNTKWSLMVDFFKQEMYLFWIGALGTHCQYYGVVATMYMFRCL